MERKLATILFVDLVDSTGLLSRGDPEVVRRRVTRFFEQVSRCIELHGGTVEKFAGDAVMAAFGVPRAHEDDAERAIRAALATLDAVRDLDLQARVGVESGEVVADESESTFATGEAVNMAARLQALAAPGEILIGPGAYGLARGRIVAESAGLRPLRGRSEPLPVWKVCGARSRGRQLRSLAAPLVGRDDELELLGSTLARCIRQRRPHLFTIYGEPGVGKSRLTREFAAGLEHTTVLSGRCLPYGEGITYWPLAEMVKSAAGISDDDPVDEALEKLREACEVEEVATLLGLASGILTPAEGERSSKELAWAVRAWVQDFSQVQPLVLVFEDIHWAEEPLLDLIEHLADHARDAPVLIICLARHELIDSRPSWGGGRLRATAVELERLTATQSEALVQALLEDEPLAADLREVLLEKTEGNPLFVEETIRMLVESEDGTAGERIPDTLQALIAARIDRLPAEERGLLQRASVIGRTFWEGAARELAPELSDFDGALESLQLRDFVTREARSSITGERAFRFKHVLIREVAYGGLSKSSRAEQHARFAEWLRTHSGEELVEIRAYHLDEACTLLVELEGAAPPDLVREAAGALEAAGRRALAREANVAARRLLLRSVELEPTLGRRYEAARAASRLTDRRAVLVEMDAVRVAAAEAGDRRLEGRALTALADAVLSLDGDVPRAEELAKAALEVVDGTDAEGRYSALDLLSRAAWWRGDLSRVEVLAQEMLEIGRALERKDLESAAVTELAGLYEARLEDERAAPLVARGLELAQESGNIVALAWAERVHGGLELGQGRLETAEAAFERARSLFSEAGAAAMAAYATNFLALTLWRRGDTARAESLLREAIRQLKPLQDRGTLVESQRTLAQVLLERGKVDEAERLALEARETVAAVDAVSCASTAMALGLVRAAQGRDEEAETLLRMAVEAISVTEYRRAALEPVRELAAFLRARGRGDEAARFDGSVGGALLVSARD